MRAPGEGETVNARPEHTVRILFAHDHLDVTWSRFGPAEPGVRPHVHREHADAFYVLEGELVFRVGPELRPVQAGAGTFVAVPPGVVHGFDNDGPRWTSFLNFHAPSGGFADYLRGAAPGFDSFDPPADGGAPVETVVVSRPGGGERYRRLTHSLSILGQLPHLAVIGFLFEPGWEGVDPHSHPDHVDAFYVLEGMVEFVGGTAGPGTFVAAPPGAVHGFRLGHPGERIALLNVHAPDTGFTDRVRRGQHARNG